MGLPIALSINAKQPTWQSVKGSLIHRCVLAA
jgi:hypothetical protein